MSLGASIGSAGIVSHGELVVGSLICSAMIVRPSTGGSGSVARVARLGGRLTGVGCAPRSAAVRSRSATAAAAPRPPRRRGRVAVAAAVASAAAIAAVAASAATRRSAFEVAGSRRLDVGDVQEAVAADAEIDERRLDARLDVDDAALVDVADVALVAGALDVQFFEHAVLEDGDAAFLRLEDS